MLSLKKISERDQKKGIDCPRSLFYDAEIIKSVVNDIKKVRSRSEINRIAFEQCKTESTPYLNPRKRYCLLNFADKGFPGLGIPNMGATQEMNLLVKFPGLFKSLNESDYYPVDYENGGVVVTDYVERYRGDAYNVLNKNDREKAMFVSAPAPDNKDYMFDESVVLQHIRNLVLAPVIFNDGKFTRPHILTVGAWGCGISCPSQKYYETCVKPKLSDTYKSCPNYVRLMAMMFHTVLIEEKMYEYYEKVMIAIPDKLNLNEFIRVFKKDHL